MSTMRWMVCLGWMFALAAVPLAQGQEWRSEGPDMGVVNDLVFDPVQPGVVYAAISNSAIWRSDDNGASWRWLGKEVPGGAFMWVEPDRVNRKVLWSGGRAGSVSALYQSPDAGATWELADGPVKGEIRQLHSTGARITFAPSAPATIFVPSTNLHYRSSDGGKSWTTFRVPGQDAYAMAIDPNNPKHVFAGGRGDAHHLSVSQDGGVTWRAIGKGLPAQSISQVLIHPKQASTLFALSGFNEVWVSTDAGENFAQIPSVKGMNGTEDARLVLDPTQPGVLWLVGEGGLFRGDLDGNWESRSEGSGAWLPNALAIDPRDGRHLLLGKAGGGIYMSDDGGASWSPSRRGLHAADISRIYTAPGRTELWVQTETGLFRQLPRGEWEELREPFSRNRAAAPKGIVLDRNGGALAFDGRDLWWSGEGSTRWEAAMKPAKEPSLRQMMKGVVDLPRPDFRALVQDPADPKRWFGGGDRDTPGEAVFVSQDSGRTWQPSGKGLTGVVNALLAPKAGVLLAATKGRALYRSADNGASWSAVTSGWPSADLHGWASDSTGRVFAATKKGLYRSDDGGQAWSRAGAGLKETDLAAVAISPAGTLLVAKDDGVWISRDQGQTFSAIPQPSLRFAQALAFGGEPLRLYVGTAALGLQSTEWKER